MNTGLRWFSKALFSYKGCVNIWKPGLFFYIVISLAILLLERNTVYIGDVIRNRQIDHIQTVAVLDTVLEVPTREAIEWTSERGCYFKYVDDPNIAEIFIRLEDEINCGGLYSAGCASVGKAIKEIRVTMPEEIILAHELLHEHNLTHPLNPPNKHILSPTFEHLSYNDRGVRQACARTRAYPIPVAQ
jgi:hypothetical protein